MLRRLRQMSALTDRQVFMTINSGLLFAAVSRGFGKTKEDVSDPDLVLWEKV